MRSNLERPGNLELVRALKITRVPQAHKVSRVKMASQVKMVLMVKEAHPVLLESRISRQVLPHQRQPPEEKRVQQDKLERQDRQDKKVILEATEIQAIREAQDPKDQLATPETLVAMAIPDPRVTLDEMQRTEPRALWVQKGMQELLDKLDTPVVKANLVAPETLVKQGLQVQLGNLAMLDNAASQEHQVSRVPVVSTPFMSHRLLLE